ncbi:MAG TPA: OmpH family outer membrane protein [Planctomycetaceae bacterium]|nr:OmpH family outer membrane protein [Planctomycetaceae bacterium]
MNKKLLSASVVAVLSSVLTLSGSAWGQAQPKEGAAPAAAEVPHKVALVDMAYVFKNYKKFEVLREDLKEKIQESETEAKSRAEAVQNLQKQLKQLNEGSPDFAAAEQKFARASADFEAFRRNAQRDFLKQESQIYHQIYTEASEAVAKYATYYKYTLVIRFNREDLDTDNAQKLIEGMNRQVVYHREQDDITLSVTDFLNKRYGNQAGASATKPATNAPATATTPRTNTPR